MKFALFYEIPVPRPWTAESELNAYRNTLEQAVAGAEAAVEEATAGAAEGATAAAPW